MDLADAFRFLADWADGSSPLYARICRGIADDPDVLQLADHVPEERWPPHVTLSAVHYLLLRGAGHPLAAYYPTVTDDPRDPEGVYPHFHDFCLDRAADLRPLLETRRTQTNAVRRCTALYPAFCHLDERVDGPLALVELGPSAGLNLNWDRYAYDYETGRRYGAPNTSVVIQSDLRAGDPPLHDAPPSVASRVGIDLHPLDASDPDDADWLRALVWPDHRDRREVLDAALSVAHDHPPTVVSGDAIDDLPSHVRAAPDDATVVVFNTAVLYQLPDERHTALESTLSSLGDERELYWLSGEGESSDENAFGLDCTRFPGGERNRLGRYEQHGRWVEWTDEGSGNAAD